MVLFKKKKRSLNKRGNDYTESQKKKIVKDSIKENFSASKGLLNRFQQIYNLKFRTLHGESGSENKAVYDEWIAEYKPFDIFYCDETSLLYRTMPKRTTVKKKKPENYTDIK